jgi:hypothetical protein
MIHRKKTKVLAVGNDAKVDLRIDNHNIKQIDNFMCPGSLVTQDNNCGLEIERWIGIATGV